MHGGGIIYHRGDVERLEVLLQGIALLTRGETDGVLCPTATETLRDSGGDYHIGEERGVELGSTIDGIQLVVGKSTELNLEYGCLKGVETGVHAYAHIVVLERSLAMHSIGVDEGCPLVVVGENRSSISIATKGFGWEKGCGGDVTKGTGTTTIDAAAESLCSVFEDKEMILITELTEGGIVGGKSEEIDCHNNTWTEFAFGDYTVVCRTKRLDGDIKGVGADIYKDGGGSFQRDYLGGGEEGEVGHEDGIALAHSPCLEGKGESIGAIGTGETMFYADILGELGLELLDLGTHDILAA